MNVILCLDALDTFCSCVYVTFANAYEVNFHMEIDLERNM